MGLNFVAIDFETANSQRGSACSVGMVRVREGAVVAQESFLIKPHESLGDFGEFQMKIHKITPAHVEDAPGWDDAVRRISNFIQDDYVVAHNAPFDSSVMRSASDVSGVPHPNVTYFCTLELTRAAIPSLENHKLKTVAKALKLGDFKHHEAEQDALIAAMICVRIAEKVNVTSITALMKGYRVSSGEIGKGKSAAQGIQPSEPNRHPSVLPQQGKSAATSSSTYDTLSDRPLTRREMREIEQREATKDDIIPLNTTPSYDNPSTPSSAATRTSSPHESAGIGGALRQGTTQLKDESYKTTSAVPHEQRTIPEGKPAKKLGWTVFLLPIIPFILAIFFSALGAESLMAVMALTWMLSIPASIVFYIFEWRNKRKPRGETYSHNVTDSVSMDFSFNDQIAAGRDHEAKFPVQSKKQASTFNSPSINIFNAVRKAKEAERRARDMQAVFDRYSMGDIVSLEKSRDELGKNVESLSEQLQKKRSEVEAAQSELDGISAEKLYNDVGLIDYEHVAEASVKLADQLADVRSRIKAMVRDKTAYTYAAGFSFNGSTAKGTQFAERMAKIMLSAYNAESENAIKSIRSADGSNAAKNKISKSLERVTKNGEMVGLRITDRYHRLRLEEVDIAAKHLLAVKLEKELEKERREELREQERAAKELQAEHDRLEKERRHYVNALRAVEANGDTAAVARMQEMIEQLSDALENVDSRVANTRAGHVYIISNVGAFGEGIVKIGMTRRLDPMDRVKELGDASVPFRFDTHALFFAEDAVGVENKLHKHFASKRVNRVNLRREFFYTTPHEVLDALREHRVEVVEFKADFEAEEYRVSQGIMAQESTS